MSVSIAFFTLLSASVYAAALAPEAFDTQTILTVDQTTNVLTSAVATIEPRPGVAGHSWVRVHFYSFKPNAEDLKEISRGSVKSLNARWNALSRNPSKYNHSQGTLQLTVDQNLKIWQVDMGIPGRNCTIMATDKEAAKGIQYFKFDGKTLQLKSAGSFVCDMKFMNIASQTFNWKMDLNVPVFPVVK